MAVFSRIYFTQLERAKRIDGEYYQPKYLSLVELHKRGQWLPIRKYLELCEYGISIKMNENGDGYKIFRMDDLKNGFAFDNEMKFAPIDSETFEKFRLKPDDILFNRVNSEEFVGRTGIFKLTGNYVFASYLVRLRTNSGMSPDALNLFLNCKYGVLSVRRLSRRAVNQANVNAQELQSILMPRFSSAFQEILTSDSNKSWTLYTESERLYKRAEQLLLTELGLQDWKPARSLTFVRSYSQAAKVGRMDAEHYHPKYDDLLQKINSATICKELSTLVKFIDHGKQPPYINDGNVFVFSQKYIGNQSIDYDFPNDNEVKTTSDSFSEQFSQYVLLKNDILHYSVGGNIGACQPYLEPNIKAMPGSFITLIRADDRKIEPLYLAFVLNSLVGRMQTDKWKSATAQPYIYPKDIKKFIIPLISDDKQSEIAQLVEKSHAARQEAKALLEKAKRAVEIAIEENEERAMEFINC